MIEKDRFLKKYRIEQEKYKAAKISWEELAEIHDDYKQSMNDLKPAASYISERLRSISAVHSLRIRLKDPEHLIEK